MNYSDERLCCIALTLCEGIGTLTAQRLVKVAGSAADVFARRNELTQLCPDIQPNVLKALDTPGTFDRAERELAFAEKHGIDCLTPNDVHYPARLRQCEDAPLFLFSKGNADLNSLRVVSIVGTRHATEYGRQFCNEFIRDIAAVCPDLLVVDSIQTVASEAADAAPGSVGQIRACAAAFLKYAKESGVPVLLIGHITKEGTIAGPKVLEHIVDTVLQFEGDHHNLYRVLRSIKNRFGSTSELGIYEMRSDGLRPVDNPSELLLSDESERLSGVAVAAAVEGVRPFLIETQALVSTAAYGTPQRSATGFDLRRLNMLLAVLEKRVGFKLAQKDVFLNIAGGLKVNDPAIDLAVISAILSSAAKYAP